jgi:hypothetical protein
MPADSLQEQERRDRMMIYNRLLENQLISK